MFNCSCDNIVKSTNIAIVGGILQITIPSQILTNCTKICICLTQSITLTSVLPIQIIVGSTPHTVLTCKGNFLYTDQKYAGTCKTVVTPRTVLCVKYASDAGNFVYNGKNTICPSCASFPVVPISIPVTVSNIVVDEIINDEPVAKVKEKANKVNS